MGWKDIYFDGNGCEKPCPLGHYRRKKILTNIFGFICVHRLSGGISALNLDGNGCDKPTGQYVSNNEPFTNLIMSLSKVVWNSSNSDKEIKFVFAFMMSQSEIEIKYF